MEANEVNLPGFTVVGYRIETNLKEFQAGLGKSTYQMLLSKKEAIPFKKHPNVMLIQLYPMKPGFNPWVDRYVQLLCYEVTEVGDIPTGMIIHQVPAGKYVTCTHTGLEAEMQRTYDYLYGQWMPKTGNVPLGYDFEIWDERYQPDSPDNEIDIFVAIR